MTSRRAVPPRRKEITERERIANLAATLDIGPKALSLSREQRAAFFAGDWPKVKGEGKCPVEVGYVHRLSSRLSFEVTMIRRPKAGGWRVEYTVLDRRPDHDRYLLPGNHSLRLAPSGDPEPMTHEEEIGYTTNPRARLEGERAAISEDDQEVISLKARSSFAENRRRDQLEEDNRRAVSAAAAGVRQTAIRLVRNGVDPVPFLAAVQRVVGSYKADDDQAA